MFKKGFYTALGTPLNKKGDIVKKSLEMEIESQISAGASGLLLMGTMGMQGCIKSSAYEDAVQIASNVIAGRISLLVGAMDNSLCRVTERLHILEKYAVDAAVLTPPFYFQISSASLTNFFEQAAAATKLNIFLYDHQQITKHKITFGMTLKLSKLPNIVGIKSADFVLIKALHDCQQLKKDFLPVFSASDLIAPAYQYGIDSYLDGIFSSMPKTIGKIQSYFIRGDFTDACAALNSMMAARDQMIEIGIWPAFSYAMNLLGFEGNFAPDYEIALSKQDEEKVRQCMLCLGEI